MQTRKNPCLYNLCCNSEAQYLDSRLQSCFTNFSPIFICVAQRLLKYLTVQPEKWAFCIRKKTRLNAKTFATCGHVSIYAISWILQIKSWKGNAATLKDIRVDERFIILPSWLAEKSELWIGFWVDYIFCVIVHFISESLKGL